MRSLENEIRERAIEIANLLIKYGYKKDVAVPVAITKAKEEVRFNKVHFAHRYL